MNTKRKNNETTLLYLLIVIAFVALYFLLN